MTPPAAGGTRLGVATRTRHAGFPAHEWGLVRLWRLPRCRTLVVLDAPTAKGDGLMVTSTTRTTIDPGVAGAPLTGGGENAGHGERFLLAARVLGLGRVAATFDRRTTPREEVVAAITDAGARASP